MKKTVLILLLTFLGFGYSYAQKTWPDPDKQEQKEIVRFFPNPAVNFITFEFKQPVERGSTIQVFSFLGRQIAAVPVNSQRVTVNVSEFFRGIYVFQLRSPNGKIIETNKFQVAR